MNKFSNVTVPNDLGAFSNAELRKLENQIARKHSGNVPWEIVIWGFGNLFAWIALWPMVIFDVIPLWLGFILASICLSLVFLPTHEAQHDIIGQKGSKYRWLNELLGHAPSWMIVYPFQVFRITHLDHHRFTNDSERDPDISTKAPGPFSAIWASIQGRQPKGSHGQNYLKSLANAGRTDLITLTVLYRFGFLAILSILAWNGYALEAALLWWLPFHLALSYLHFFLSWVPHHPGKDQSRYGNTRNWRSMVGNIGTMGMQYHIVHHLHPYIPLTRTPAAYREMLPILKARGCSLEMV